MWQRLIDGLYTGNLVMTYDQWWDLIGMCSVVLCGCMFLLGFCNPRRLQIIKARRDPLDTVLYRWDKKNALSVRGLVAGGIHAFGQTSSGKTSSMQFIAKAILKFANSSVLVLCGKKGEAEDWLRYCEETGRSGDVIRFGIDEAAARFNMIDYELKREGEGAGQVSSVVRFLMELRSVIFRQPEGTGGESMFWRKQEERELTHAVTVLKIAGREITPQAIHDVVMTAPNKPSDLLCPQWSEGACNQVLREAHYATKTPIEEHDFKLAQDYFTLEWPNMAPETRASVLVGTIGTLTTMNTGLARELFASRTTITPKEMIEGRKIVLVNFPLDEHGDLCRLAAIGLKWHWQREVLRRRVTKDSPIAAVWGDESSMWVSDTDATYLSRCRSCKGCMVYICQSLDSYREVLPGEKARSAVEAMLSNFSHKLFFALGDHATAEWAANLCGRDLQQFGGGGVQYGEAQPFQLLGKPQYSSSFNTQFEYLIQPSEFLNDFRTGAAANKFMVDAILVRSGALFANGLPVTRVAFNQKG